jgi:hypothetical protein
VSLAPSCRQFTAQARRFRAYVRDTQTGKVVIACDHEHRSRLRAAGGKNGEFYAMKCARRMLRRLLSTTGRWSSA